MSVYQHTQVDTIELTIPAGVTSLAENCLRNSKIGVLTLPDTLHEIGTDGNGCALSDCTIGDVEIPRTVEALGEFAFGNSNIGTLIIHGRCIGATYARQFKGCKIRNLQIHTDGLLTQDSGILHSIQVNDCEINTLKIYLYKEEHREFFENNFDSLPICRKYICVYKGEVDQEDFLNAKYKNVLTDFYNPHKCVSPSVKFAFDKTIPINNRALKLIKSFIDGEISDFDFNKSFHQVAIEQGEINEATEYVNEIPHFWIVRFIAYCYNRWSKFQLLEEAGAYLSKPAMRPREAHTFRMMCSQYYENFSIDDNQADKTPTEEFAINKFCDKSSMFVRIRDFFKKIFES